MNEINEAIMLGAQEIHRFREENKKLNNILNELEKHFEMLELNADNGNKEFFEDIVLYIRKLKQLKETK